MNPLPIKQRHDGRWNVFGEGGVLVVAQTKEHADLLASIPVAAGLRQRDSFTAAERAQAEKVHKLAIEYGLGSVKGVRFIGNWLKDTDKK